MTASHDMGADLTYKCLGGDTYEFTLVFYRSCEDITPAPFTGELAIRSNSCGFGIGNAIPLSIPLISQAEVSPICPADLVQSQCADITNPYPGVEQYIYEGQITLPAKCNDWNISWSTCCRNANITNAMIDPSVVGTEMRLEIDLNNLDVDCNNSPTFTNIPTPFIASGEPYWYNHGVIDSEGDSLVYEMVTPIENDNFAYPNTGSIPVTFLPGFSATQPVATNPPNGFEFDGSTGQMYFIPDGPQWDIMTVKVSEYRDGVLIGSVMRDIQIVVRDDNTNKPPTVSAPLNVTGGSNDNYSFSVCADNTLAFDLLIADPDPADVITIAEDISAALPGAVVTTTGTNPLTLSVNWATTTADIGNYFFYLNAEDSGCPIVGRQSVGYIITVHEGVLAIPKIAAICPGTPNSVQLGAQVTGGLGAGTFLWSPATGLSDPNIPNPIATVSEATTYTVTYSEGGCVTTDTVQIVPEGTLDILTVDPIICLGDSTQLESEFNFTLANTPTCGLNTSNCVGTPTDFSVGTGTTPTGTIANGQGAGSPFPGFFEDARTQVLYRAADLQAAGLEAGLITDLAIMVVTKFSTLPYTDFRIRMGCTADNTVANFTNVGLNTVFQQDYSTVAGLNNIPLDTPYEWDGTSNLLIEFCYNRADNTPDGMDHVLFGNTAYNSVLFSFSDIAGAIGCDLTTANPSTQRPNIQFTTCALTAPTTYSWSPTTGLSNPNIANPMASPSNTTTYTITANTPTCTYTDTLRVNVSLPPALDAIAPVTICEGDSIQLNITGSDITNATFSWNPAGSLDDAASQTPIAFPATSTNYLVTATNQCGNGVGSATVNVQQPPSLTIDLQNISCNGANDGSISITPSGSGGYRYSWAPNIGTTRNVNNLSDGIYSVTVSDANNCTTDTSLSIIEPPILVADIQSVTDANCNGENSGQIIATASGGTPGYTYALNTPPFFASNTFDNLGANIYTLTVKDASDCEASITTQVGEPEPLVAEIVEQIDVDCNGNATGVVELRGIGGTGPYEFSVDNTFSPNSRFTNLTAGSYTGLVRDANGCVSPVQVNIAQPSPLTIVVDPSGTEDVDCFGASTGSISVSSMGGTAPYQFSLDDVNYGAPNFLGLSADDYEIYVRDDRGCQSMVLYTLNQPTELIGEITEIKDVSCFDGNDGQITATVSGGDNTAYFFGLNSDDFIQTGIFGGLSADTVDVIFADASGCRDTVTVAVSEPTELILDIQDQTDVDCNGNNTGSITLTGSGGTPGYTFSEDLTNYDITPTFGSLTAGMYSFGIEDANGCTTVLQAEVLEPEPLGGDIAALTPVDCNGNSTGSVTISPEGGTPNYEFDIDNRGAFSPNSTFDNLLAGTHIVDIQDDHGCTSQISFNISQPSSLSGIIDVLEPVDCNGNSTGVIGIRGTGGTPTYQFSDDQTNFSTQGVFTNLNANDYLITIQDANGCKKDTLITVTEPEALRVVVDEQTNVKCNGSSSGMVTTVGAGGTPNYEFSIDNINFNNLGEFNGLEAGDYLITIRDDKNCLADSVITITQPDSLEILLVDQTDALCNGTATASFEVNGLGGTPNYTFSLGNNNNFTTNLIFDNLTAGPYNINIRDSLGCTNTMAVQVGQPMPLVSVIDSVKGVDCFGNTTGEIALETAGGTAPYRYSIDANNFIDVSSFANLPASTYNIIVRDSNNCETSVPVNVLQPDSLSINFDALDATCNGLNNGSILANVSGGTPNYTYQWDNNPAQNQDRQENLQPGTYTLVIIDDNNCRSQQSVDINEPDPILLTTNVIDESCTLANGEASVTATGGTGDFQFAWQTTPIQQGSTAIGLSAGPYTVIATDANGCESQADVTLIDHEAPVLELDNLTNASCFGLANGSISILATMGTGTYSYSWSTNPSPDSPTISNIGAGSYTVTVDDGRCTSVLTAEITEPDSLYATIADFSVPRCSDSSDGEANVEAFGGTPDYTYSWNSPTLQTTPTATALPDGTFMATITDANGCEATAEVVLTAPGALAIDIAPQDVKCSGNNDGSALANVEGGTPPYRYDWSNGSTDSLADGLGVGSYTITVLDFNDCVISQDITLDGPPLLESTAVHTDLTCFESNDGTAEVAAIGGVPPYRYNWSNGSVQPQIASLISGDYFVEVADANDCADTTFVFVDQPDDIVINIVDKVNSFCDEPNGSVLVDATGGTPDYTYSWNTGVKGNIITDVLGEPLAMPHVVTVVDLNGCEKSLDVGLKNSSPAFASFELNRNPDEPILLSQSEIMFVNTSQNSTSYTWYFGDLDSTNTENPTFEFPEEGEYTVRLVANDPDNACPDDTSLVLNIIFDGVVYVPNAFTPNGDGHNDLFRIGAEGIVSMELIIFDRWGKRLRTLLSPDEGWDGTNGQGNHVQEGVYTFVLKAVLNSGRIEDRGGTITLIR